MKESRYKTIITAVLCFLLPAIIVLIAFAKMKMAPFGESSTMIMDMSGQYVEFLCGLKSGDVFFSWSKALGGNYIGVFTYYVSSPLSFLTLFCPNSHMPIAVLFLTVLKIGLAGLTFSLLLRYRFGRYDLSTVLFSMFYGLMSYNIAYSMCIMWLDGVIWLPLIILGIEKIFEGKNSWFLTFSLFVSFISTYYISYMTGLFTAIYFLYRCFENKTKIKRFFRYLSKFVLSVVVAASWGAFLLLPTLASLFQGKIGTGGMDYRGMFNFSLSESKLRYKFLPGGYDSITNSGTPFIYCSILAFLLFIVFFALRKISLRSKISTGLFTILIFCSLWFCRLDKVWHVFQYPNWFPYRYSFLFSFLILLTAYRAFVEFRLNRQTIAVVLLIICSVDMYGNTMGILKGLDREFRYESYEHYHGYKEKITPLVDETKKDKDGFFRVGATFERTKNEPIGFNYKGITHYSSTYNRHVNSFLQKMGMAQAWLWSSYFGSTMVTDALFSVKYVISEHPMPQNYSVIKESGTAILYYNPNALSIGMAAKGKSLKAFGFSNDSFQTQNALVKALTGTKEDCFISLDTTEVDRGNTVQYTFVSNGMPIYAHFTSNQDGGELLVNGSRISGLFSNETRCIQYIGTFPEGENVNVEVEHNTNVFGKYYYMQTETFERAVAALRASEMSVDYCYNGRIGGTVTANEGDMLFTTIPYDEGWKAYVDGKQVKLKPFADSLITIPLTAGTHKIKLIYIPTGFIEGICISVIPGLLVLFMFFITKRFRLGGLKK